MMKVNRILDHPVLGKLKEQREISFIFDGKEYRGYEGDTIASALLAHGIRKLRVHEESGSPRGIYCNIGHCFECRVIVDGTPGVRACLTELKEDAVIESGTKQLAPFKSDGDPADFPRTYTEFEKQVQGKKEG